MGKAWLAAVLLLQLAALPAVAEPTFLDQIQATLTVGDAPCTALLPGGQASRAEQWLMGAVAGMRRADARPDHPYAAVSPRFDQAAQLAYALQLCKADADGTLTLGELAGLVAAENRRRQDAATR